MAFRSRHRFQGPENNKSRCVVRVIKGKRKRWHVFVLQSYGGYWHRRCIYCNATRGVIHRCGEHHAIEDDEVTVP